MLLACLLMSTGLALGASVVPTTSQVSSEAPAKSELLFQLTQPREARSNMGRDMSWWQRLSSASLGAPEPEWRTRPLSNNQRGLRYVNYEDYQPASSDTVRDYRFEPYRQQELAYERPRERDFYDNPRYMDIYPSQRATAPRRVVYYDDLSRSKAPYYNYQQQPSTVYGRYTGAVRSPSIGVSPYRYGGVDPGRNTIMTEGTVESAPLLDDPYRSYNPRQPAPWSVQVGTSLTVKDDGRHAARRFYVQSQREQPGGLAQGTRPRAGRLQWSEQQQQQPLLA